MSEISVEQLQAERDALASDVHSARLFLREKDGLLREFHAVRKERDTLAARLAEMEGQEPVAWYVDDPLWGREYNTCPNMSDNRTGTPLYARPVPAEPVNVRLLEALKKCRNRFAFYVEHHRAKGDSVRADDNEQFVTLANEAIARAEAALAEHQPDADGLWKSAVIDQLVISHILTAEHENNPRKALQDLLAYHADIAVDPRVSEAAARLIEQGQAEENEACAKIGKTINQGTWAVEDFVDTIRARGEKP